MDGSSVEYRVLVADDLESIRTLIARIIARPGIVVDTAVDGVEVLEKHKKIPYDVIFLDISMPRKDGLEALQDLRASGFSGEVIILSGEAEFEAAKKAVSLGAVDYLSKSSDLSKVRLSLDKALKAVSARRLQAEDRRNLEAEVCKQADELQVLKTMTSIERERINIILNAVEEGLIAVDQEGAIAFMNSAAERILLKKADACIGVYIGEVLDYQEVFRHLEYQYEFKKKLSSRINHEGRILQLCSFPVMLSLPNALPVGTLLILEDVTLQENAILMRENLLSIVSHELRTPMTALVNYLFVLGKQAPDGDPGGLLPEMKCAAARLEETVNKLVRVSLYSAPSVPAFPEETDIRELAGRVIDKYAARASEKRLSVSVRKGGDNGRRPVTDKRMLSVALECLMDNAVKFAREKGRIFLTFAQTPPWFDIAVFNEGEAIPETHLPFLYSLFSQAEDPLVRTHEGMGTGLYIARQIMGLLSGKIEARNAEKGVEFTLKLPDIT